MAWRQNKYKAFGVRDTDGHFYPSKGEAARAQALKLEQAAGIIGKLKFHPTVEIFPGLSWKLDSTYVVLSDGIQYWEDFKGVMTREVMLKIKIWEYLGPGPLRIVKGDYRSGRFHVDKTYKPKGLAQFLKDHTCATP